MPKTEHTNSFKQALRLASKLRLTKYGNKCGYCGVYADTRDHIIPVSFLGHKRDIRITGKNNIVRCCRECNSLASNNVFENIWEKKKFLAEKVHNRYKDLIYSPIWTPEEIKELDGNIKTSIEQMVMMKKIIEIRVENLLSPEIYDEIHTNL